MDGQSNPLRSGGINIPSSIVYALSGDQQSTHFHRLTTQSHKGTEEMKF
jgi:hypothetical protein